MRAGFVFPSARGRPIFDLHKLATEVCNKLCDENQRIMEAVAARIMSLVQRRDDANMVTFTG